MGVFLLILQVLQALPPLVQMAETVFSGKQKSGTAKKDLVLATVKAGLDAAAAAGVKEIQRPQNRQAIYDAASKFTDGVVAAFNAADVFKRGGAEPQA